MPPKDDTVYVGHMLDTTRKALELSKGKKRADFDQDEPLKISLVHLIQIIGEAARRVSNEFCESHPDIPWRAIIGMRNKVVHDYFGVDYDVVWDTVIQELEPLAAKLEKTLNIQ